LLQILDTQWKDHLHTMDGLREGIHMRAYGQRDPKLEYQREGYALFDAMQDRIDQQVLEVVYKVHVRDPKEDPLPARPAPGLAAPPSGPIVAPRQSPGAGAPPPQGKVGRNDPCPCGSGRKYKKCHGAAA
jgi:preprotein translocase subunit SecA